MTRYTDPDGKRLTVQHNNDGSCSVEIFDSDSGNVLIVDLSKKELNALVERLYDE